MGILFVAGCIAAALATFCVLLWSPRPTDIWAHLRGFARWGVFASAMWSAAGLSDGWASRPTWESVLFVWTVAAAYALQAYSEARRQRGSPVAQSSAGAGR